MKDNKKKVIVIGALGLIIVCLGAFQMAVGTAGAIPPHTDKKEVAAKGTASNLTAEKIEGPKNPEVAMNLAPRDPFQTQSLPTDPTKPAVAPTATAPTPPQPRPHRSIGGTMLPPMQFEGDGPLGAGKIGIQPEPSTKFGFMVSGVMLGAKPMAVFTDAQGNQRLIMLGGSLDADSKVLSIERDAVTVRFHGKTLRLTVEGNPNAK